MQIAGDGPDGQTTSTWPDVPPLVVQQLSPPAPPPKWIRFSLRDQWSAGWKQPIYVVGSALYLGGGLLLVSGQRTDLLAIVLMVIGWPLAWYGWEKVKQEFMVPYEEERERFERVMPQWVRLVYCHRDSVVFIPNDGRGAVPPDRMDELIDRLLTSDRAAYSGQPNQIRPPRPQDQIGTVTVTAEQAYLYYAPAANARKYVTLVRGTVLEVAATSPEGWYLTSKGYINEADVVYSPNSEV